MINLRTFCTVITTVMNNQVLTINCVVATLFSLAHCLDTLEGVPTRINRRLSGDVYYQNQSNQEHSIVCNEGRNTTYLVADRCCISNQHIFNGNTLVN